MDPRRWLRGIRLYIACVVVLLTLEVVWWAVVSYDDNRLRALRIEEVYGWLSLGMLTLALGIGPALKLFPHIPGAMIIRDARRMVGIGAAWCAALHTVISYDALFHLENPLSLATPYQQSFVAGMGALIILLAMAFTSFDKAFHKMGKWWFRLHRLIYAAVIIILLHTFMIGSHATTLPTLATIAVTCLALVSAHIWIAFRGQTPTIWQIITISYMAIFLLAALNYGLTRQLGYNFIGGLHHDKAVER